jgi:hypothetical protein
LKKHHRGKQGYMRRMEKPETAEVMSSPLATRYRLVRQYKDGSSSLDDSSSSAACLQTVVQEDRRERKGRQQHVYSGNLPRLIAGSISSFQPSSLLQVPDDHVTAAYKHIVLPQDQSNTSTITKSEYSFPQESHVLQEGYYSLRDLEPRSIEAMKLYKLPLVDVFSTVE